MESSQVGSVGQSVNQSINQSINQLINQSIHCLARRTQQTPRSDQIRFNSTQLNSTQIKPDQVREPCRRVSSDIERGVVGWGCAARRCRCDAMHFSRSRRRFLFFACLLACWLAGLLAGLVNNLLDRRNCSSCWCSPSWLVFRHRALQISLDHFTRTPGPSLGAGSGNPSVRV
jgi:hypothetical protein